MIHSDKAVEIIKEFEGCRLKAYQDQNNVWTIGYGHTGSEAYESNVITLSEAVALLNTDLAVSDRAVSRLVKVDINQNQFDALVSLVFNIGQGHFSTSSCLHLLNAKDFKRAALHLLLWNKAAGIEDKGLKRRRLAEKALFETTV